MKKRQLEMTLQGLEPLKNRSSELEQYSTPADVAADLLWEAFGRGDIEGKSVADLGTGNGVLAVGAKLLGASRVVGIDIDHAALDLARRNAASLKLDIDFVEGDVRSLTGAFDTVVQNPPFGAQKRHADRPFIEKAIELARSTYSLHLEGTEEFVAKMVSSLGGAARPVKRFKFEIPYAFEFHSKSSESVSVILFKFER